MRAPSIIINVKYWQNACMAHSQPNHTISIQPHTLTTPHTKTEVTP